MTFEALTNRQYNLTAYESQRGGSNLCCALWVGRIARCPRRDSFDSICTQSCFLSYPQGLHGHRLAMADRFRGLIDHSRYIGCAWADCDESNLSASAHTDSNNYFHASP